MTLTSHVMTLATILLVLNGMFANAEWKVDERCMNATHRNLQREYFLQQEMQWEQEDTPVDTVVPRSSLGRHANTVASRPSPGRHLRGKDRQLQQEKLVFRLKMFWREGYCWQEEWQERFWCQSCNGGTCNVGDNLWIQECSDADIQLFTWEPIVGTGGGKLKPFTHQGLCLEHTNSTAKEFTYTLQPCDDNNKNTQIITGWRDTAHFELYPFGESMGRCITQGHHPKPKETIVAQHCGNPRWDHTNFWTVYQPMFATPPTTIPKAPWEICRPGVFLAKNNITEVGYPIYNDKFDAVLEQQSNGNLVVKQGDDIIWESNVTETTGDYFTKLQGDGNLVTYKRISSDESTMVWRSAISGPSTLDYFLGLACDKQTISIYEYTPDDPGRMIWTTGDIQTLAPTPSPQVTTASYRRSQFRTVPFNMSALEFTDFSDYGFEHQGNCGVGPVDASIIEDAMCHEHGSQCAVTHTFEGEWLVYTFSAADDVTVDISLRTASPSTRKRIRLEIDGVPGFKEATSPGTDWHVYEDVMVWSALSLEAGVYHMKISFLDGYINICSISVSLSSSFESAVTLSEEMEQDLLSAASVPPSSFPTMDSSVEPSSIPVLDPSLVPILTPSPGATFQPTLSMTTTAIPSLGETAFPSESPSPEPSSDATFQPTPSTTTTAIPTWEETSFPSESPSPEPEETVAADRPKLRTIPFDISALEYTDYIDHGEDQHGDCSSGPVDAEFISDTTCHDRGSKCGVGWRKPGDMLEYTFETTDVAVVELVLRIADNDSKQLTVDMPGIIGHTLVVGPGRGWYEYEDVVVWNALPLPAGIHTLRVFFISGQMNLCSLSLRHSSPPGRIRRH